MKVELISHTLNPERVVAAAARGCYSVKPSSDLMDKSIPNAHGSCYEHISFTFSVSGVSRAMTHQLVRHRTGASYSQQSQRYVDIDKTWENIVIPPTVNDKLHAWDDLEGMFGDHDVFASLPQSDNEPLNRAYYQYIKSLSKFIDEMDKSGIPSEDKRYFIPQGTMSNITVTMNARELQHFCGLRRCKRAQWEIRELADRLAEIIQEKFPELCEHLNLGPQCEQMRFCPEDKSCGKFKKQKEVQHKCWYCGGELIWSNDFSFEDCNIPGEGIVTYLQCSECGANVSYTKGEADEEN